MSKAVESSHCRSPVAQRSVDRLKRSFATQNLRGGHPAKMLRMRDGLSMLITNVWRGAPEVDALSEAVSLNKDVDVDQAGASKLQSLQVMRGVAAVMVAFHHAGNIIQQKRFYGHAIWGNHLANFNVGVDFFFVLSGFIISWVHWGDIGRPERLKSFILKRVLRIYPLYWTLLIPLSVLYLMFPSAGAPWQHEPRTILLSFLLLPDVTQPVLGVAWTLTYEVFFYFLFALLIASGKKFIAVLVLWSVAIIYFQSNSLVQVFPWSFVFSPLNMEFLAGMAVAAWLKRNRTPAPAVVALVGGIAFLYFTLFRMDIQNVNYIGRLALGSSSVAIILGLVELERRMSVKVNPILLLLGTASYAVYLVHPLVLSGLVNAGFKFHLANRVAPEVFVIFAAVTAVMVGVLYHLLVETRLSAKLRQFSRP